MIGTTQLRTFLGGLPAFVRWRPSLRLSVGALAVGVVLAMAVASAHLVAGHLRASATDSAVQSVEAIVRGYIDPRVDEEMLALDTVPDPAIGQELERLTASGDIRVMSIWSRDGRIVYSTASDLRGRRFSIGGLLATAFLGTSASSYGGEENAAVRSALGLTGSSVLDIVVPIRGGIDGSPIGVLMVEQDARPIEARVEGTRRDVFLLALIAALVLVVVLALSFGATSALLGRQNRMLRHQREKEQSLMVGLRRSEERFRSLVRNSSDIILIIGADGTIAYESPAVVNVLGYEPDRRLGQSAFEAIYTSDREWIRTLVSDIARNAGAEVTADFRARHADGSIRWLQATLKNLLDDPAVGGIVVNYRDITERRELEEQLRYQAFHDALSGLPNRALFLDRLEHALTRARRDGSELAVLFLDLDDFKSVNDNLGHPAGDELLVQVAERLSRTLRDADTAARMGGDEFAVLLEHANHRRSAREIADRILDALRAPFEVHGREVRIHGSVGIAMYGGPEQTADDLLRHADVAMYAAKTKGKDRWMLFEPDVHRATIDRHQLRADLPRALDDGQLHLVYQPLVELETLRVKDVEALVRWRHPERGLIPPAEFIPLAEESGLIVALGRWVLREACRQGAQWQAARDSALGMSVNISARQLDDEGLVEDVAAALRDHALDPSTLTLEITESILLRDVDVVQARLEALKALGVRLAIDDFGTGYSSFGYLRRFPIDVLKIDRSFVSGVGTGAAERALVRSILSLGQILGMETVAEGIEDLDQLATLRSLGTQLGQGYLFAEPSEARMVPLTINLQPGGRPKRRHAAERRLARNRRSATTAEAAALLAAAETR